MDLKKLTGKLTTIVAAGAMVMSIGGGVERIVLAYSLLIVPTFDVIRVIIHRIHYKKPIFDADKSHIHHKFMSLGMNQHQALIAILMLQLGYIIFNLLLFHIGCNFTWILCIDIITYTLLHIFTTHRIQKAKK